MRSPRISPIVLVALSLASRLPALLNPETTNSDAAIVGLQAMHMMRGEVSPLLFGSTYQTSVDSGVAALSFALMGATPLALMVSALALHTLVTLLVFGMLRAAIGAGKAMVLSLLLVFTGAAIHSYALYPPREAGIALAFAALYAFDRACRVESAHRADGWRGGGAALTGLAIYADPYALVIVPGIAACAAFSWPLRASAPERRRAIAALAMGGVLGLVPLVLLSRHAGWRSGEASLSLSVGLRNARLLASVCGPWAFGLVVYRPEHAVHYVPWIAPPLVRLLQWLGGGLLVVAAFGAPWLALARRGPASDVRDDASRRAARRLGVVGGVIAWSTLGGFLFSVMVMDEFSMRYLAAAILAAPLGLAPFASRASIARASLAMAPMVAAAWIGGWASFGTVRLDGLRPVLVPLPGAEDERALLARLEQRGIHAAVADYWVAYRMTFLAKERLIVLPTHTKQDRYAPYGQAMEGTQSFAYIIDELRSEEPASAVLTRLRSLPDLTVEEVWHRGTMTAALLRGSLHRQGGVRSD